MTSTLIGNGVVGQRENGIVVNGENWNSAMPTKSFSQGKGNGNGNGNGTSCWTPGKPVRSNPQNQVETENWEDLVEIYQDLLKEETLNLNKVAQNLYPTKPPSSTVENIGNQNQVAILDRRGRPPLYQKKNQVNRNLNSTPIPNLNHNSHQASTTSFAYFPSEDPANWDSSSLLAAIVRPKKSSASLSIAQNKSFHALNRTPVPNPSTQVGSNSIGVGSIVGIGNQQSHTFTSNKLIGGGYNNSKQLPTDGFPVPYHHRPCYNLNSPPRSEQDAASSGDSTSSTTQKEHQVAEEEGDGFDLNKTPQPARRKKHRPKVIRQGKPKKTKDPKNSPPSNETTRVKRKYVMKKKEELNFDLEIVASDGNQMRDGQQDINLNASPREIEQERRISSILERSSIINIIAQNNRYAGLSTHHQESSTNRMQAATQNINVPATPMAKARDHALMNVLARNMTIKNPIPRGMDITKWVNNKCLQILDQPDKWSTLMKQEASRDRLLST